MVQLSVYRPPSEVEDDAPAILPFARCAERLSGSRRWETVARARLERANRQCPCCRRVTVEPIELPDAVTNWNGATVPGTATIVGFRCNACRHRWTVRHGA